MGQGLSYGVNHSLTRYDLKEQQINPPHVSGRRDTKGLTPLELLDGARWSSFCYSKQLTLRKNVSLGMVYQLGIVMQLWPEKGGSPFLRRQLACRTVNI